MSKVEIIVLDQEDAKTAEAYGADRLELVSAMSEGGLTPSYGTIKTVVQSVRIPVMVMLRPHSYSFVYQKEEWAAIREDIKINRELGAAGIVFGALTKEKKFDKEIILMLLEEAKGLSVTFHRAIDDAGDPLEIYQSLLDFPYSVDRILTSGGKPTVLEGIGTIQTMLEDSKNKRNPITIMPGSGLTVSNIDFIHQRLQASEYHFGSAVRKDGDFRNRLDGDNIQMIKHILT
jgi:copper homeostasis protein